MVGHESRSLLSLMAKSCLLVLTALVAACAVGETPSSAPAASTDKLKVVATTTQVTALAKIVGADLISLTGVLSANTDPHEYEPTPNDVKAFALTQVIVVNGVGLEKWLEKTMTNSGSTARVIDCSHGVMLRQTKGDQGKVENDPHIWHSVPNAIIMLHNIRDGLSQADPSHASVYQANAAAYELTLKSLDQYITNQTASIPPAQRKLVSNHDTFGYYAERYGLTVVGSVIPSMDTNYQPAPQDFAELVKAIRAQQVKAIFTESSINPKLAQQIAQEAGVKVVNGALYGDTLGPPGSDADSLDGMLKHNTDLIVSNLK